MSDPASLVFARLCTEEGFRSQVYRDQKGNETIGYGFNISAGVTKYVAAATLQAQIAEVLRTVSVYPWWHPEEPVRGSVILDIGFNNGVAGLLHFPKMLVAYGDKNWATASAELLDSNAARELPTRYNVLAELLLNGQ